MEKKPVIEKVEQTKSDYGEILTKCYFDDLNEEPLKFHNYTDEWLIFPDDLLGKTRDQASETWHKRDVAYLRS